MTILSVRGMMGSVCGGGGRWRGMGLVDLYIGWCGGGGVCW